MLSTRIRHTLYMSFTLSINIQTIHHPCFESDKIDLVRPRVNRTVVLCILHIFPFESFDFSISGLWSGFWCSPGPFNCAFQKFPQRRKAINPYMWSYMGIAVALGISVLGEDDLNALDSLDIVDLNSQAHARKDFLHS